MKAPTTQIHRAHTTDVAIIGAGPYGLSLAAHLRKAGVRHRIFGRPMQVWQEQMPKGMCLKSDGFASSLFDPEDSFTLEHYCREENLPYQHSGLPVPLETFVNYGLEFQKRMVPQLEMTDIATLEQTRDGFVLCSADGETIYANRVVLAVGIAHFSYTPPLLQGLPQTSVTHSSQYGDVSCFRDRTVVVVGAGASAIDLASALADEGAHVQLIGRREKLAFYTPDLEPRPLKQRVLRPRTGLGLGWKYVLCMEAPVLFHAMPRKFRHRVVRRHLGPVPAWFMRDKIENRIPLHLSAHMTDVQITDNKVHIAYKQKDGEARELVADHVIAATGYRPSVSSLRFVAAPLRDAIATAEDTPVLNRHFETSVPGLHMIGLASANSFGPASRFAVGARFTARHLCRHFKMRPR
ncbi:NAD(P)-binding domain-containing protein [Acidipila sp. EB88]|uniref:NAD(P)-binding domain-containing protein n=1 Tax=Acidipila sp. EB88 TaxID=2305226 RepID=UPI000F5FD84D|nr:NAD(P)/FAD-dependent oxidoreductase [Acidipila sp. EB88]RRA49041.1 NAD(P)/FAD-dependent oxidoreductase [Acidipila sp. EB88]